MKKSIGGGLLALFLVLGLSSCGEKAKANDPAVAAAIMTQATYSAKTSGKAITLGTTADFTGSAYASDFAGASASQLSMTFTDEKVNYEGKTYTLNGTINYGYKVGATIGSTTSFAALIYCSGFSIVGPDFDSDFSSDLKEDIAMTTTSAPGAGATTTYTITMDCTLNGSIAGTSYSNKTTTLAYSFTF